MFVMIRIEFIYIYIERETYVSLLFKFSNLIATKIIFNSVVAILKMSKIFYISHGPVVIKFS